LLLHSEENIVVQQWPDFVNTLPSASPRTKQRPRKLQTRADCTVSYHIHSASRFQPNLLIAAGAPELVWPHYLGCFARLRAFTRFKPPSQVDRRSMRTRWATKSVYKCFAVSIEDIHWKIHMGNYGQQGRSKSSQYTIDTMLSL